MGDGSILSIEMEIGWEDGEDGRLAVLLSSEAGSMRWMGDGSILSIEMEIGWEDGEDGRLTVLLSPIYPEKKGRTMSL
ncbi:hypothetical protein DY000_02058444 [Brassica cretica]|uniref:Uncharacterized protein n=1 Tax=Brassica cretica TaxID=69181 RepID=A0ABQ7B3E2_BRACR|nr:hypothetical protein DY000_02058444 [Brassica cretica]